MKKKKKYKTPIGCENRSGLVGTAAPGHWSLRWKLGPPNCPFLLMCKWLLSSGHQAHLSFQTHRPEGLTAASCPQSRESTPWVRAKVPSPSGIGGKWDAAGHIRKSSLCGP